MVQNFPDESQMPRSASGEEPIRGGSIGLNRILGHFVDAASVDRKPSFEAILINAFTIFRNIHAMVPDGKMNDFEEGFVRDVNLFLEYFDTYLSLVWNPLSGDRFCPVIIYFADYHHVPKAIEREHQGKRLTFTESYKKFLAQHGSHEGEVRKLDHSRCVWVRAGDATYPHKEVARKFRDIIAHPKCLVTSGSPLGLVTHVPLDYHISKRLRHIRLIESYTGKIRKPEEFRFRLDKEGRVPFLTSTHLVLGDDVLIKPMVTPKIKKTILETAEKERWLTRSEGDIQSRLTKITQIPSRVFQQYDFV